MHVRIFKTAHHLDDRRHLADVREELIAQALALARPAHQTRDIHKLDGRGHDLLRMRQCAQRLKSRVRHRHDALVRVDGAERIIGRLRLPGPRDRIEQGGFANIRESNDTGA